MPTYEYRCKGCGHEFEEFQSIAAAALTECPLCSGDLYRIISGGGGLIFKGSGFYETDYKRKKSGETEKKEEAKTTPKTEISSKTETKAATKE